MTNNPDYVEVNRKAHELANSHGRVAHSYAAKLAAEALYQNETEEHQFWKAVEAALVPR